MTDLTEIYRAVGQLESSVKALFDKSDKMYNVVARLDKSLSNRRWWDSVKIFTGAYCGGITAVAVKMAVFGG